MLSFTNKRMKRMHTPRKSAVLSSKSSGITLSSSVIRKYLTQKPPVSGASE